VRFVGFVVAAELNRTVPAATLQIDWDFWTVFWIFWIVAVPIGAVWVIRRYNSDLKAREELYKTEQKPPNTAINRPTLVW